MLTKRSSMFWRITSIHLQRWHVYKSWFTGWILIWTTSNVMTRYDWLVVTRQRKNKARTLLHAVFLTESIVIVRLECSQSNTNVRTLSCHRFHSIMAGSIRHRYESIWSSSPSKIHFLLYRSILMNICVVGYFHWSYSTGKCHWEKCSISNEYPGPKSTSFFVNSNTGWKRGETSVAEAMRRLSITDEICRSGN